MKTIYIKLLLISLFALLFSCASEDIDNNPNIKEQGYSFFADITGFQTAGTRANRTEEADRWTLKSFNRGDLAGFYSAYGNNAAPDGNGSFNNEPMSFNGNKFINPDIDYNTDYFKPASTFYYYPYTENVDDTGQDTYYGDDYGIDLRTVDNRDGITKYKDLLWIINSGSTSSASFGHVGSSLIFLRDEGFKNAENRSIKVVLTKGVSHAVIEDNNDYLKNIKFVYLKDYKFNGETLSEDDCKIWEAWDGDDYIVNDPTNSTYDGNIYPDAQYIILPSSRSTSRLSVDHIEVYDDNGQLRTITDFTLYNGGKQLYYGQQYPLVIKMKDLQAVVETLQIVPWEEDEKIIDERAVGINNPQDFNEWVLDYNNYIANNRQESNEGQLSKFGDKTITNGVASWTFYINNDLDLSGFNKEQINILSTFTDKIEGFNHTLNGLSLENSTPPSFIGSLGEYAIIKNLNFKGFNIVCTNPENTEDAGGLFKECKGTLENCIIDGVVKANGKVGLVAATGQKAVINKCTLSGLIIGKETTLPGIFGEITEDCTFISNSTSGLIFQPIDNE